jgi:O-antigen/teichoic acid export membrane protein
MAESTDKNIGEAAAFSSIVRRLASGSGLRTVNFFVTIIVSFFMMPFVVHSLGDRLYGFWALVGTFLGYYGLLDLGLTSAVSRHIAGAVGAKDDEECNHIFNAAFFIYLGLGLCALLITAILAASASLIFKIPHDATLFWKIILILGVNTAINFPVKAWRGILTAQLRYDIMSILELLTLGLRTLLIIFVLKAGYGILAMAWVTFISNLPEVALVVYFSKKNLFPLTIRVKHLTRKSAKTLFSYSTYAFIAQMADQLRFNVDGFVIAAFVSLAAVTHYNVSSTLVRYFISLMIASMGVFQPVFSRQFGAGDHESIKKTFFFATRLSIYLASFVGFGLIAWGKPFIQRWMGQEYLDAYPCLVILALGSTFALWQIPSVNLLYGTSRHRFYALFNTIEGVSNLLLSLLLVKPFGIIGVAIGTFIPMAIMKLVIQPIYVCRTESIRHLKYIFVVTKAIVLALLALIVPLILSLGYVTPDYLTLGAVGVVSLVWYFLTVFFIGLSSKEKDMIRGAIIPRTFGKEFGIDVQRVE